MEIELANELLFWSYTYLASYISVYFMYGFFKTNGYGLFDGKNECGCVKNKDGSFKYRCYDLSCYNKI